MRKRASRAIHELALPQNDDVFRQEIKKRLTRTEIRYLSDCSAEKLESLLSSYLGQAQNSKEHHGGDGGRRGLKWARSSTSKFLNNFNNYLQAYSGIVQMMNGVGPNYGDVAYGALSLLLLVAVNKEKTQDIIGTMLFTLQEQYSRIERLKEVYATAIIQEHIAVVYRLGIEFAHQAALYYSRGTFQRFLYLLSQPPSVALEGKVSEIKKAIKEMRMEMETQDRIRLNNIEREVGHVKREVGHVNIEVGHVKREVGLVKESVEVLHVRIENERFESLQHLLQVETQDSPTFVRDYERRLADTFDNIRRLPPFDAKKQLFLRDEFIDWRDDRKSSLLLLQGKTVAPDRTLLSWHSSATTRLACESDKYLGTKGLDLIPILSCFCQVVDYWDENSSRVQSADTVISRMVCQLLKMEVARPLLRDDSRYGKLKRDIEDLGTLPATESAEKLGRLYSMLERLFADLALKRAFIILDRVDRIQGNMDKFLDPLLGLLQKSKCVLKVLITIRTEHDFDDSNVGNVVSYTRVIFDQN